MVSFLNEWIVGEYRSLLEDKDGVVLLEFQGGLSVEEAQEMRNRVRESGARLRVTKRRLAKVAFRDAGVPIPEDALIGSCALLVGDVEQTIGAAKAIEGLWKKEKDRKIAYRAAFLDGSVMNSAEAARIPHMPDKQTLRGMLAGVLSAPGRQIATLLNEVAASTARAVQARADQGTAE